MDPNTIGLNSKVVVKPRTIHIDPVSAIWVWKLQRWSL